MVRVHVRPLEAPKEISELFLFLASRDVSQLFPTRDFRRLFCLLPLRDFRRGKRFKKLNATPLFVRVRSSPDGNRVRFYLRSSPDGNRVRSLPQDSRSFRRLRKKRRDGSLSHRGVLGFAHFTPFR